LAVGAVQQHLTRRGIIPLTSLNRKTSQQWSSHAQVFAAMEGFMWGS
jgi:hypothetical protein